VWCLYLDICCYLLSSSIRRICYLALGRYDTYRSGLFDFSLFVRLYPIAANKYYFILTHPFTMVPLTSDLARSSDQTTHALLPSFWSLQFWNLASTSGVICLFIEFAAVMKASNGTCGWQPIRTQPRNASKSMSTHKRSLHVPLHSQQRGFLAKGSNFCA
jgi:hypothetical protein